MLSMPARFIEGLDFVYVFLIASDIFTVRSLKDFGLSTEWYTVEFVTYFGLSSIKLLMSKLSVFAANASKPVVQPE